MLCEIQRDSSCMPPHSGLLFAVSGVCHVSRPSLQHAALQDILQAACIMLGTCMTTPWLQHNFHGLHTSSDVPSKKMTMVFSMMQFLDDRRLVCSQTGLRQ